jgi:predicted dehydrogenase
MSLASTRRTFLMAGGAAALHAQTQPRIRIALIGTGHRSWALLEAIKALPDLEVVALADPTPTFRDKAISLIGGNPKAYDDYHKLLAEQKIDAVVVATPGGLHADPVVAALERGLHVICEKPMATSVEDANRMIAASRKSGKVLQIAHQMRYTPVYVKLHEMARGGQIGELAFVTGGLLRGDWNPQSWRAPNPKTGVPTIWRQLRRYTGTSMMEDGIHEFDILNWIIGSPLSQVYAAGGNRVYKDRETIDHAAMVVEYQNGLKLSFDFSLFGPARQETMILLGAEGSLELQSEKIKFQKRGGKPQMIEAPRSGPKLAGSVPGVSYNMTGTYNQFAQWVESIRTGKPPLVDGEAGKGAIRIALMAQKSIDEKRIIKSSEFPA